MITTVLIAVISTGVALAGLMIGLVSWLRADMRRMEERSQSDISLLRQDVGELRERMAHLEGLLEGLRDSIMSRAA